MVDKKSKEVTNLTDRMRKERENATVLLHNYNILRSKASEEIIIAVEGDDDAIYYQIIIEKIRSDLDWEPLVCNGKGNVLELRELLLRNRDKSAERTYFIVDKDFDGLREYTPNENTYCTLGYSFENHLVSDEILKKLLVTDFKCHSKREEVERVLDCYRDRLKEFFDAMRLANKALYYCRTKKINSGHVENKIRRYIEVTLENVTTICSEEELVKLAGLPEKESIDGLTDVSAEFDRLDPHLDWRGKYLMGFFIEFLSKLRDDRKKETGRKFFKDKKPITFEPKFSTVRILSSSAKPASCLRNFVNKIPA